MQLLHLKVHYTAHFETYDTDSCKPYNSNYFIYRNDMCSSILSVSTAAIYAVTVFHYNAVF